MSRLLTPRRVALLWLLWMTNCAPLQPLPPPPVSVQPVTPTAACTGWTWATGAWPIIASLIAQQLEAQRTQACALPPAAAPAP